MHGGKYAMQCKPGNVKEPGGGGAEKQNDGV